MRKWTHVVDVTVAYFENKNTLPHFSYEPI